MELNVLIIKYNNLVYSYKIHKNDKYYSFPVISISTSQFFENYKICNYKVNKLPLINKKLLNNEIIIYNYYEIFLERLTKEIIEDVSSLWIPNYFLNNLHFDLNARFYLRDYNKKNPVLDFTYEARVLLSNYYFMTKVDLYKDIKEMVFYILNNKVKSGVSSKEEAYFAYINKNKNNDFILSNKDIIKEAIIFIYDYYDTSLD